MAGLEEISKKPSDEEDKKGSSGYGTVLSLSVRGFASAIFRSTYPNARPYSNARPYLNARPYSTTHFDAPSDSYL